MKKNRPNQDNDKNFVEETSIENIDYDEKATCLDALEAVNEILGEYKKSYNHASKKDKRTILAIVLPLVITFILGFVGVLLANIGQYFMIKSVQTVGFVCMGVGLGGFFLTIIAIIIWSKIKESR